jgi:hypothetical protein
MSQPVAGTATDLVARLHKGRPVDPQFRRASRDERRNEDAAAE